MEQISFEDIFGDEAQRRFEMDLNFSAESWSEIRPGNETFHLTSALKRHVFCSKPGVLCCFGAEISSCELPRAPEDERLERLLELPLRRHLRLLDRHQ